MLLQLGTLTFVCDPTHERLKQQDCPEFEASLDQSESLSLKISTYFVEENQGCSQEWKIKGLF